MRLDLDLLAGRDLIGDTIGELGWKGAPRKLNGVAVGIERKDVRGVLCDAERESTVAAAELEHAPSAEVSEAAKRGEMRAFRVENSRHRL